MIAGSSKQTAFEAINLYRKAVLERKELRVSTSGTIRIASGVEIIFEKIGSAFQKILGGSIEPINWREKAKECINHKLTQRINSIQNIQSGSNSNLNQEIIKKIFQRLEIVDENPIDILREAGRALSPTSDTSVKNSGYLMEFLENPANKEFLNIFNREQEKNSATTPETIFEKSIRRYLKDTQGFEKKHLLNPTNNLRFIIKTFHVSIGEAMAILHRAPKILRAHSEFSNNKELLHIAYLSEHYGLNVEKAKFIYQSLTAKQKHFPDDLDLAQIAIHYSTTIDDAIKIREAEKSDLFIKSTENFSQRQRTEIAYYVAIKKFDIQSAISIHAEANVVRTLKPLPPAVVREWAIQRYNYREKLINLFPKNWSKLPTNENGMKTLDLESRDNKEILDYIQSETQKNIDNRDTTKWNNELNRLRLIIKPNRTKEKIFLNLGDAEKKKTQIYDLFEKNKNIYESVLPFISQTGFNAIVSCYQKHATRVKSGNKDANGSGEWISSVHPDPDSPISLSKYGDILLEKNGSDIYITYNLYEAHVALVYEDEEQTLKYERINSDFKETERAGPDKFTARSTLKIKLRKADLLKRTLEPTIADSKIQIRADLDLEPRYKKILKDILKNQKN